MSTKKCDYGILKESLASYFEWHFANKHGVNNIVHRLENEWHRYSTLIYPYSDMFNGVDVLEIDAYTLLACVIGPFIGVSLTALTWKFIKDNKETE